MSSGGMRQVKFPQQVLLWLAVPVWLLATGCSGGSPPRDEPPDSVEKVTLKLDEHHGTRFLGFYVARDRGFYAGEGLEVAVEDSPGVSEPDTIPIRAVVEEFDFAVGSEALVQAQQAGLPVVVKGDSWRMWTKDCSFVRDLPWVISMRSLGGAPPA